jgi:hypothetical protein
MDTFLDQAQRLALECRTQRLKEVLLAKKRHGHPLCRRGVVTEYRNFRILCQWRDASAQEEQRRSEIATTLRRNMPQKLVAPPLKVSGDFGVEFRSLSRNRA